MRDYKNPNKSDVRELLDSIIEKTPVPDVDLEKDFTMLVSQIESNKFYGKMLIGRIASGLLRIGDRLNAIDDKGIFVEGAKVHKIIRRLGTMQVYYKSNSSLSLLRLVQEISYQYLDSKRELLHIPLTLKRQT